MSECALPSTFSIDLPNTIPPTASGDHTECHPWPEFLMRMSRWFAAAGLVFLSLEAGLRAEAPANRLTYEQHVRPILKAQCFQCHGEEAKPKAKLDLRLVRLMKQGGVSGAAIVAGRHEESLLWDRLDADEMPPGKKKLASNEKELIASWIDQGALTVRPEPNSLAPGLGLTEEERSFWSFQPIRHPEPPRVRNSQLVRTPIDAFLLSRLESEGLSFAPETDRRALIRRATFDVTGLPPSPEAVEAFLADPAPGAYERLIEGLLASPRYGERWGRYWLDVARYSDDQLNSTQDEPFPNGYRYRDWVIQAFNDDMPYD
jgi:hypothetical protein